MKRKLKESYGEWEVQVNPLGLWTIIGSGAMLIWYLRKLHQDYGHLRAVKAMLGKERWGIHICIGLFFIKVKALG